MRYLKAFTTAATAALALTLSPAQAAEKGDDLPKRAEHFAPGVWISVIHVARPLDAPPLV